MEKDILSSVAKEIVYSSLKISQVEDVLVRDYLSNSHESRIEHNNYLHKRNLELILI